MIAASRKIRSPPENFGQSPEDSQKAGDETDYHQSSPSPENSPTSHQLPMLTRRDRSSSKRSAGSFSHNEARGSYEEDDDTPTGYNYLPPVRQLSLDTTIERDEDSASDTTAENYTYLPPPKSLSTKKKQQRTTEDQATMNLSLIHI